MEWTCSLYEDKNIDVSASFFTGAWICSLRYRIAVRGEARDLVRRLQPRILEQGGWMFTVL